MSRKICERALNWIQIIDYKGTIRLCSWMRDNIIGSLSCQNIKQIYHSERAYDLREKLMNGDYSLCNIDECPYLAMNDMNNHMIEIDDIPEYPTELYLGFEEICNYSCTCCNIQHTMRMNKEKNLQDGYDKIEEQLKELLPHLKKISANGLGELFCSKRTLKLLSEWKPLSPAEEISVVLETNGSLFDNTHWKQISNLGQYNLSVAITVMSFDEVTYQYLSGTTLPICQIEENLRFVKNLREKEIINYLELATVVQERNFRTLPEFVKRCIEEFGADAVRLRPYAPSGSQKPEIEWFMDVRNPNHPYYTEYRSVMENVIFKHPKVKDWSGGRDTFNLKEFPYSTLKWSNLVEKCLTNIILNIDAVLEQVRNHIKESGPVVIYGFGNMGKSLAKLLMDKGIVPEYILDKNKSHDTFWGIEIYNMIEVGKLDKKVTVIITPLRQIEEIRGDLLKREYQGNFLCIKDIVTDKALVEELFCE